MSHSAPHRLHVRQDCSSLLQKQNLRPLLVGPSFRYREALRCGRRFICRSGEEEPNWDEEMSIFKKRTLKPNQLAALRRLEEEKVASGKV